MADLVGEGPRAPAFVSLDFAAGRVDLGLDVGEDLGAPLLLGRGREDEHQVIDGRGNRHDRKARWRTAADYSECLATPSVPRHTLPTPSVPRHTLPTPSVPRRTRLTRYAGEPRPSQAGDPDPRGRQPRRLGGLAQGESRPFGWRLAEQRQTGVRQGGHPVAGGDLAGR